MLHQSLLLPLLMHPPKCYTRWEVCSAVLWECANGALLCGCAPVCMRLDRAPSPLAEGEQWPISLPDQRSLIKLAQ